VSARGHAYACGAWQTYFNSTSIGLIVQSSEGPAGDIDAFGISSGPNWLDKAVMQYRRGRTQP